MTTRRNFLFGLGAALAAPAIVRSEHLMQLFVPKVELLLPETELILPEAGLVLTGGRVGGVMSRTQLREVLLPGLQELFGRSYDGYADVFADVFAE